MSFGRVVFGMAIAAMLIDAATQILTSRAHVALFAFGLAATALAHYGTKAGIARMARLAQDDAAPRTRTGIATGRGFILPGWLVNRRGRR